MIAEKILEGLSYTSHQDIKDLTVQNVTLDSREIKSGDLFIALKGEKVDGHEFIEQAQKMGAALVFGEREVEGLSKNQPYAIVKDLREVLGLIASRVYGDPSLRMTVIGITGTNGKTTTSFLVRSILQSAKHSVGLLGTITYEWAGLSRGAIRTTPEATSLHQILHQMQKDRVTHVVMECSSHGLALHRLVGLHLDVAVFTNLSQDHLDFHRTLDEYANAKKKLFFDLLPKSQKAKRIAVLNMDDPLGRNWASELQGEVLTYSIDQENADVYAKNVRLSLDGIAAEVIRRNHPPLRITSSLVGRHNLENLLAAISVAHSLKIKDDAIASGISALKQVPGRLERVGGSEKFKVFVDYAHTDDALENVLDTLRPFQNSGRIWTVFGCGGDRDRGKRPKMGNVVFHKSDWVVMTSDNPRSEDPEKILKDIQTGLPKGVEVLSIAKGKPDFHSSRVFCEVDREKAIAFAIENLQEHDVLLIAGKGHETIQEIRGERLHFDDREVAQKYLERKLQ